MTTSLLDELTRDEFELAVGALVPPSSLRLVLQRNRLVQRIADAVRRGMLTEQNLRDFVSSRLAELRHGVPFEHDVAIAALGVALEGSPSQFAAEFLSELAGLAIAEMQQSILMARECLRHRRATPRSFEKSFSLSSPLPLRGDKPDRVIIVTDRESRQHTSDTFLEPASMSDADGAA
jgi:hypothetical protein